MTQRGDFEFLPHYCNTCHQELILNRKFINSYESRGYPKFHKKCHPKISRPDISSRNKTWIGSLNPNFGNHSRLGMKFTAEWKNNIRKGELNYQKRKREDVAARNRENVGEKNHNFGKKPWNFGLKGNFTPNSGQFQKGHIVSPETKEKLRQANLGRKRPDIAKKNIDRKVIIPTPTLETIPEIIPEISIPVPIPIIPTPILSEEEKIKIALSRLESQRLQKVAEFEARPKPKENLRKRKMILCIIEQKSVKKCGMTHCSYHKYCMERIK